MPDLCHTRVAFALQLGMRVVSASVVTPNLGADRVKYCGLFELVELEYCQLVPKIIVLQQGMAAIRLIAFCRSQSA